jgi:cell division protein FtsI (penicillin-binding protein 3)
MKRIHWLTRLAVVLAGLVVLNGFLVAHVYHLQVGRHDELHSKAQEKCLTSRMQLGRRGVIYDSLGTPLAGNMACRDILAEPRYFNCQREEIIQTLSTELQVNPGLLRARFARADAAGERPVEVVVARQVDIRVAEHLKQYEFRGLRYVDSYSRFYPKCRLLANLVGFLDESGKGSLGIEQLMESYLQPTPGRTVFELDRRGRRLESGVYREVPAADGWDVFLTIQEPIQQVVEDELAVMAKAFGPRAAYALMMDPTTGAIMAWAQVPSYDPNDRSSMRNPDAWQNFILTHGFEPGSIMKGVSVAGALDYGVVGLNTSFDCEHGCWFYGGRPLRDAGHHYDTMTVAQIIQKSSNIGTAKIALQMGDKRLYQVLSRFGFGEPVGLGFRECGDGQPVLFPAEATGIFRKLTQWDTLSVTRFPIGQGILVTPLQMVQAYAALANGGVMVQPYIIDHVRSPKTGEERYSVPRVKGRTIRPDTATRITQALKLVTQQGGTAPKAAVPGYETAGKTGTSQKWVSGSDGRGGFYASDRCVASFIGYVPADAPAFVLLVVADEPTRGGSRYGGIVAAPTFSRIAERTLRYMQVAPSGLITAEAGRRRAAGDGTAESDVAGVP